MARQVAVINVVALSESVLGPPTPRLNELIERATLRQMTPPLPAVTTTSQANMLTGQPPHIHGIVGNGWYDRQDAEVKFWKQSNHLVRAEKVWETARARDPSVTCAKMFWWYNMYSSADCSVTPRPIYKADGRKIPDCYAEPPDLRDELTRDLGRFPLFKFWGPGSSAESTRWIVEATKRVCARFDPTLTLVYLPHLDYALQKHGPGTPEAEDAAGAIDALAGELIDFCDERGIEPIVVSEYGIEPVSEAVEINRVLRREGLIRVRAEEGRELLDAGASAAFGVCDHQVAHVYVKDPGDVERVADLCARAPGVARVLDDAGKRDAGLDHERAGDLVLVADDARWFAYPYWLDDARAPDFARTVDIHRKPGYDPVELFIDPAIRFPKLAIAARLLRKKLGFRTLMDVIATDTSLVRGSHGRADVRDEHKPVLIARDALPEGELATTDVRDVILGAMGLAR